MMQYNVFYQCLWYMNVMYAHVSWLAVLLRKINPWWLEIIKSLNAVGENKSLTAAGDSKSWLLRMRNPCWLLGNVRILHDFPGDIGILQVCLGNLFGESRELWWLWLEIKENADDLYWGIETLEASIGEMRMRIFDPLGNNSVGRMFILLKSSQRLGLYANLLRNYPKLLSSF